MQWSSEAVQLLNSLERYTVLKAIEEGKKLVKRVTDVVETRAQNGLVSKSVLQDCITSVLDELDSSKR